MLGTAVNAAAVVAGSAVGLAVGRKVPKTVFNVAKDAIGLFTLFLGFTMAGETGNPLVLLFSLIIGALSGAALKLEERMESLVARMSRRGSRSFVDGMMTAFLTYCVGPMTIVGSLRDGMGDPTIILTKSVMDGVVSIAYAASLGAGVMASAAPLFLFQGSLALLGWLTRASLPSTVTSEVTACGGVLLLGVAVNLLELRRVKVGDMLPALLFAALLALALG